ncbi:MAG: hypothetical protein JJU01_04655 [Alkalibacterium sp.]|nr:hypothetical protein [Alkalibacterium sp.]TVP93451.1 MAG: hypothetical protein EA249_00315 [Alkalibacterium sp.]
MNNYADNDYFKFQEYAESIGMTPEEYAISLHQKHQKHKAVLLQKGPQFKQFVEEFHAVLDSLVMFKESGEQSHSLEHHELFKKIVHLLSTASSDPKLLAQLYNHYPNGIDDELNELKSFLV